MCLQELQRQKAEYENKKKIAEQLRIQHEEEEEKDQRRRAAQRIQDEQRAVIDRQREQVCSIFAVSFCSVRL